MSERLIMAIGLLVGFLFGFNGIAMLFNMLSHTLTEAQAQLTQISTLSTIVLFMVVVGIIIKVRVLSSLIFGAVVGAIINALLEMNGIHVMNAIYSTILHLFSLKIAAIVFF